MALLLALIGGTTDATASGAILLSNAIIVNGAATGTAAPTAKLLIVNQSIVRASHW